MELYQHLYLAEIEIISISFPEFCYHCDIYSSNANFQFQILIVLLYFFRFLFSMERNRQLFKRYFQLTHLLINVVLSIFYAYLIVEHDSFLCEQLKLLLDEVVSASNPASSFVISRYYIFRLLPPKLFEKFIDAGHYQKDLNAYSTIVEDFNDLPVRETVLPSQVTDYNILSLSFKLSFC